MKKNFKKVLLTTAMTLLLTSTAAMAAYSDIPDTHPDASAINMLSALGIVEGYDDGSFHPDEEVTRAEMAALTIKALNIANAEKNLKEAFSDVPLEHWAAAYIATASDNKIINGMGDGTFEPDSSVTFAQASKMLVALCGYESWAENQGGYPSGYILYANQTGITMGVTGVSNNTALTRANCARMIANAMEAPMLMQTGMTTNYLGQFVAIMNIMDGTNEEKSPYASILTQKWDIFPVYGTVTAANSETESFTYKIEKAKNYLGTPYGNSLTYSEESTEDVIGTKNDMSAYLSKYTQALIHAEGEEEPDLIYIEEAIAE